MDNLVADGRLEDARAALDALPPAERDGVAARMSAARLHLAADRPDAAVRELTPVAERDRAAAPLLALYGRALLAAGDVEEAARAYATSAERDANLPEALFGRAQMAVRARSHREALFHLRRLDRALEVNERPAAFRLRARLLRGRALLMAGRGPRARRVLAHVIASDAAPAEAYFHYAQAQVGHDHGAAREAFERYLELEPDGHYARRARRALGRAED